MSFAYGHAQCVTADQDAEDAPQTCYGMETTSAAFRVLTGFCFFALAAAVAGYGFKVCTFRDLFGDPQRRKGYGYG